MTKLRFMFIICIILTCFSFNGYSSERSLVEAEKVAKNYMTAFFRGDLKLSFSLIDQDILKKQKDLLENAYKLSIEDGTSEEFLKQFRNVDNFNELLKHPPNDFFAILSEKDRDRGQPENLELMKKTIVSVVESSLLDDGNVKVILEIINPKPDGTYFKQNSGLILSNRNGKWVVLGNAN